MHGRNAANHVRAELETAVLVAHAASGAERWASRSSTYHPSSSTWSTTPRSRLGSTPSTGLSRGQQPPMYDLLDLLGRTANPADPHPSPTKRAAPRAPEAA